MLTDCQRGARHLEGILLFRGHHSVSTGLLLCSSQLVQVAGSIQERVQGSLWSAIKTGISLMVRAEDAGRKTYPNSHCVPWLAVTAKQFYSLVSHF